MSLDELKPKMRVRIHPASDVWMQGYKFATVVSVGVKWVHVDAERLGRTRRIHLHPDDIMGVFHRPDGLEGAE